MSSDETSTPTQEDPGTIAAEFLQEILDAMGAPLEVEYDQEADGTWRLEIVGEDSGSLIGRYGETLNALQYLVTLVTQRRTGQHTRITLDAEGYRQRRQDALTEQAQLLAAEVAKAGQEAELDPLNPFERRIIHNALADHPDVITYSEGEEPERRVVIAPRPKPEG